MSSTSGTVLWADDRSARTIPAVRAACPERNRELRIVFADRKYTGISGECFRARSPGLYSTGISQMRGRRERELQEKCFSVCSGCRRESPGRSTPDRSGPDKTLTQQTRLLRSRLSGWKILHSQRLKHMISRLSAILCRQIRLTLYSLSLAVCRFGGRLLLSF